MGAGRGVSGCCWVLWVLRGSLGAGEGGGGVNGCCWVLWGRGGIWDLGGGQWVLGIPVGGWGEEGGGRFYGAWVSCVPPNDAPSPYPLPRAGSQQEVLQRLREARQRGRGGPKGGNKG